MRLYRAAGLIGLMAGFIVFQMLFYLAYLHPGQRYYFNVGDHGEADIELVLNLIFLPLGIIYFISTISQETRKEGEPNAMSKL